MLSQNKVNTQHFIYYSREQSYEFPSKFSSIQCQSSTLWFQLVNARCSWNVQKNKEMKSDFAKPWLPALWDTETERLYWDKGCFQTPSCNCIFKSNLGLQVILHLTRCLFRTHIPQMEDCQNMLIIPIINKWFCLRNNRSDNGKLHALPCMRATLRSLLMLIFLCFPY